MFSRTISALSIATLGATLLMGCSVTDGSGVRADEKRQVATFSELEIHNVDAIIVVDPAVTSSTLDVALSGDDNLVTYVNMHVDGARLVVDVGDRDIDPRYPLQIVVRTPRLTKITADREARVDVTLDVTSDLSVDATSSAKITARGAVAKLDASLTGSAVLNAKDLVARDVVLDVTGSSSADVCATGSLDADVAGSSDARYFCDPRDVDREVSGSSHLDRR